MRKLWGKIMNNKLLVLSILFFFGTVIFAQGCASVATLTSPAGQTWTYKGAKKVEMFWKTKDGEEIHYSGKSSPWWKGLLGVFSGIAANRARGSAENVTEINLSP